MLVAYLDIGDPEVVIEMSNCCVIVQPCRPTGVYVVGSPGQHRVQRACSLFHCCIAKPSLAFITRQGYYISVVRHQYEQHNPCSRHSLFDTDLYLLVMTDRCTKSNARPLNSAGAIKRLRVMTFSLPA